MHLLSKIKQKNSINNIFNLPKISQLHQIDPTLSEYLIYTKSRGDFIRIFHN